MRHHVALGADSVWQFGARERRQRLAGAADVAGLLRSGRLQWVSDDIGIPHVAQPRCGLAGRSQLAMLRLHEMVLTWACCAAGHILWLLATDHLTWVVSRTLIRALHESILNRHRCTAASETVPAAREGWPSAVSEWEPHAAAGLLTSAVAELQHWDGDRACALVLLSAPSSLLCRRFGGARRLVSSSEMQAPCPQVATLANDDCLQLSDSDGSRDIQLAAAECFGPGRTWFALTPANASHAEVSRGSLGLSSRIPG